MITPYITKTIKLTSDNKKEMFSLFIKCFDNVNFNNFINDINEKDWVIILKDTKDKILGFSTLQVIETNYNDNEVIFLYSGDTITDKNIWNNSLLAGSFVNFMLRLINKYNNREIYWLLISKGFRTYRYLPVYFKEFYPVFNKKTPEYYLGLLNHICKIKFREEYDSKKGIICHNVKRDYLNPEMSSIPESRKKDQHVQHFLKMNPGYKRGDELVCITKVSEDNFKELCYRVARSAKATWVE